MDPPRTLPSRARWQLRTRFSVPWVCFRDAPTALRDALNTTEGVNFVFIVRHSTLVPFRFRFTFFTHSKATIADDGTVVNVRQSICTAVNEMAAV